MLGDKLGDDTKWSATSPEPSTTDDRGRDGIESAGATAGGGSRDACLLSLCADVGVEAKNSDNVIRRLSLFIRGSRASSSSVSSLGSTALMSFAVPTAVRAIEAVIPPSSEVAAAFMDAEDASIVECVPVSPSKLDRRPDDCFEAGTGRVGVSVCLESADAAPWGATVVSLMVSAETTAGGWSGVVVATAGCRVDESEGTMTGARSRDSGVLREARVETYIENLVMSISSCNDGFWVCTLQCDVWWWAKDR